jgi:hypothetical protein
VIIVNNVSLVGPAYRITNESKLEQISPVELNLSDEQLREKFLKQSK